MNTEINKCNGFKKAKKKFNTGKRKLVFQLSEEQLAWVRRVYPTQINTFI